MILKFDIYDNAEDTVQWMINTLGKDGVRGALKSTGWFVKEAVQQGIERKAPGGVRYAPFMGQKVRYWLDKFLHGRGKKEYKPMGRLKPAVKYAYMSSGSRGMSVVVGWNSASSASLGGLQQRGSVRAMSDKFRNALNAALEKSGSDRRVRKTTTTVKLPARVTIPNVHRSIQANAVRWFELKLKRYLRDGVPKGAPTKKARVYKIY